MDWLTLGTVPPTGWLDIVERFGIVAGLLGFFVWWTYQKDKKQQEEREEREKEMSAAITNERSRLDKQTDFVQQEMLVAINNQTTATKDVTEAIEQNSTIGRQTIASLDAMASKLDLQAAVEEAKLRETDSHDALPRQPR